MVNKKRKCCPIWSKEYYRKNKKRIIAYKRKFYADNKEKLQGEQRERRKRNLEKYRASENAYNERNRRYRAKKQREYAAKNRKHVDHQKRKRVKERCKTDISFKLKTRLRSRFGSLIRYYGGKKKNKTIKLLGCSFEKYKKYIEKLFKTGMSWENYGPPGKGKWQIDHIIAIGLFDLTKICEQKRAFHYKNTQPLRSKEHRIKTTKDLQLIIAKRKIKSYSI